MRARNQAAAEWADTSTSDHQCRGGENAWTKELLRQPAMAGVAPPTAPAVADENRALSIDRPMTDRHDGVAAFAFRRFAARRVDHRLRCRIKEGAREHQEDDHRPPMVKLADDLIE
jgi:hypothetical protein